MSSLETLKQQLPDYARDLKINLGTVLDPDRNDALSAAQIHCVALASAIASRNPDIISAVHEQAEGILDAAHIEASKAAAAIMGMNNVYYRFIHLASNEDYGKMPAGLRMNVIGNPGIDKADFELLSLAVSAINGCGLCIDSHEKVLIKAGMTTQAIQSAVKIASVIHAVALVVESEASFA